jgi:hypothetical protein
MGKIRFIVLAFSIYLLTACAPTKNAIETAIYQTQAAAATSTYTQTPIPTDTPTLLPTETPTPSPTPSPTPDLRTIQGDPPDLLMIQADLPRDAKYYIPNELWTGMLHNEHIVSSWTVEKGKAYLAATGRIDGMWVEYNRGSLTVIAPETIFDNVAIFQTAKGAQLVIKKYEDNIRIDNGYTEMDNPPQVGDITRAYMFKKMQPSGEYRVWIGIAFSCRNIFHYVEGYGWEREVTLEYVEKVASAILARMEVAPLVSP